MNAPVGTGPSPARRGLPVPVVVLMALAVWAAALWPGTEERSPSALARPKVRAGRAADLAAAINGAPRAVVYVGCEASVDAFRGRRLFLTATADMAAAGADPIEFFVIEEEASDDAEAWARGFRDERLNGFGALGWGWAFWLEGGRLRAVDGYVGRPGRSPRDLVERTRAVWP